MNTFKDSASLYDLQYISAPTVSDDNNQLFYVHTIIDSNNDTYQSAITCTNLKENTEETLIKNDYINKNPILLNNHLIYLSNQTGHFQAYLYDFTSQSSKQLTNEPNGIQSITANPTYNSFVFTTQLSEEISKQDQSYKHTDTKAPYYRFNSIKYQADGTGFIDSTKVIYLCEYSLIDGKTAVLTPQATGYGLRRTVSISSDGNFYVLEQALNQHDPYNSDTGLFLYNRNTSELTWITEEFPIGIFGEAVFSPNDAYIAFIGNPLSYETANQFNLYIYDCSQKKIRMLSENWDIQFGDNSVSDIYQHVSKPMIDWQRDSQAFYVLTSEYGQVLLNKVSIEGEIQRISDSQKVVKEFTVASDDSIFAAISSPDKPASLFRYSNQNWKVIETSVSQFFSNYSFSQYVEVETSAEDGGIIHGLMSLPIDFDPSKKYPLILNIHGGPYMMHAWNFYHEVNYLSAQGYIVLLVNPRGSYGYGQAHTKGVYERYGKEDYTDLMTAVDYVIDKYSYVDTNQLFVTGGSYGGYMTNWIITQNHRFKAGVSQRSMSNFVSMFGTSDIGYFFYKDEFGLDISDAEELWQRSPLAYVQHARTPLLLIHAKDDLRCQFDQAQQFYVGLKHYNRDAELLVFPDSSHELSRSGRPSYRVARLEAILEWFERYK